MNRSITATGARGFSIVEIMVAMALAMLGMIVIFQVFAVSEGYNRTASSGSDAQQNGAYSLTMLEQEIRQAGWGFNNSQVVGCNVLAYSQTIGGPPAALTPGAAAGAYILAPIIIDAAGTTTGSDTLEVNYGNQNLLVAPVALFQSQTNSTDNYVVTNGYGFSVGDVVLATQPPLASTLAQVTSLPAGASPTLAHDASKTAYPYNQPGGSGVAYNTNARLYDLGAAPTRDVFSVVNNQLVVVTSLASAAQNVVSDNIVQLKAQYGKDDGSGGGTAGDGIVDGYDNVTPSSATACTTNNATAWNQVLTVRVGLVARSSQPEKPSGPGPACDTTTTAPSWSGGNFDLSADPNWMCYRYKVFETVIPVKNNVY